MNTCWSPDGDTLMYSDFPFFSKEPGKVAVHLLNLKTQRVETLPGSEGFFSPNWSPDGRYVGAMASDGQRIMLFDFKSRAWAELVNGSGLMKWSRDGQYLYYLRYGPESAGCHAYQNKRPPGGRGGELEGNPPGRAAGGAGVWHDSRWCSDGAEGRRNARDLFARLVRAIIAVSRRG